MGGLRVAVWQAFDVLPRDAWLALTWLGDSALLLPAAVALTLWLALAQRTRPVAMLQWALLFGPACLLILASKLAFMGWCLGSARLNFTGISGHAALSASLWPVLLWLVACRQPQRVRALAVTVGVLLALAIGASRLALFAHSVSEVLSGLVLGFAVSSGFLVLQHHRPLPRLWGVLVLLSLGAPLLLMSPGKPAPTHNALESLAMRLAGTERACTREDLLPR